MNAANAVVLPGRAVDRDLQARHCHLRLAHGRHHAVTRNATYAGAARAVGTYRANACGPDWALIQRWDGKFGVTCLVRTIGASYRKLSSPATRFIGDDLPSVPLRISLTSQPCQVRPQYLPLTSRAVRNAEDLHLTRAHHGSSELCSRLMLGTKRGARRKGIEVREGSVAQARREADLTLAQVAGGELSRTAIHLIEKGMARPSMETLKHIAHKTGKPMSFFLRGPEETSALYADLKDLQKAKSYLAQALAAGQARREPRVQAEVRMLVGQAEEWCGNTANADEQFETAIRILEQLSTPELLRDAHMAYAELLEARQDIPAAAHHWKVAAEICKLGAALGSNGAISGQSGELPTNMTRGLTA